MLRKAYGWPPRVLGGHANALNRRLGDLHALDPLQFFLSRGCAHPMTKARRDARAEWLGRATVFQVYDGVGHVSQCLIVVIIMLNNCHVQQKIGIGKIDISSTDGHVRNTVWLSKASLMAGFGLA
jgi:hypothetical protein